MMPAGFGFDPGLSLGLGSTPPVGRVAVKAGGEAPAGSGAAGAFHAALRSADGGAGVEPVAEPAAEPAASSGDPAACGPFPGAPAGQAALTAPDSRIGEDSAWTALAQWIQGMILLQGRTGAPEEPPEPPPAAADPEGEGDERQVRFIELLKQLESGAEPSGPEPRRLLAQLRGLLMDAMNGAADELPPGWAARLSRWAARVVDSPHGAAWGRLAQLIPGPAAGEAAPLRPYFSGGTAAGPVPPPVAEIAPIPAPVGEAKNEGPAVGGRNQTPSPEEGVERPIRLEHAGGAGAAPRRPAPAAAAAADPPHRTDAGGPVPARDAAPSPAREAAMPDAAVPPPARPAAPPSGDGRDETAGLTVRDLKGAAPPATGADRIAEAGSAAKPREAAGHGVKSDVVDQIVQRAALLLKSDRGEARIDLKPEFLGQVRMHVVTENQLVSVRILTESPMVRELIEHNLHQLKSDLQQLGLQVERVEVSVSEDPRRDAGRHARAHGRRNLRGLDADEAAAGTAGTHLAGRTGAGWLSAGGGTISMFA